MATGKAKESNFYATLGLKKDCSASELRKAYKKLALRWHPDRCSASGNTKYVEESKKKFQAIQEAYSVLSDSNKRFMYDIGVYDSGDDDDGMGDFLGEMVFMMSQSNQGNEQESFEDLQDLFEEMFQRDLNVFGSSSQPVSFHSMFPSSNNNNTRNCSNTNRGKVTVDTQSDFSSFEVADSLNMRTFCAGVERTDPESSDRSRRRKNGRKLKVSSNHDVSCRNAKISA